MTIARHCPQCHKPLSTDAPQGLCPECLLKAAFSGESSQEAAATGFYDSSRATMTPSDARTRLKYFGDYELLKEIDRGGMGVVWKARQSNLNREVALKMIRAGALASPDEIARFLREAEAAANLQHPNIVAIHEVGEHQGQHYFSMDLVSGRDLGALITEGPLAPQRAARYVKIIAEAIHFAHQRGALHRDLKPQNVLIDTADQPRITDFGLAKIMKDDSQLTQSGVVMGSPSYMPPEQAAGRHGDIGPASDVYSLGAMLYELLTGRPPFRGATAMATLHDVMESGPVCPRRLKADIPPDLDTICLKCLEKSPSARYPSARALAEELDRFLKGEPIQARPAGAVRKAVSWVRRHPGTLAALATLVMVTLMIGVYYQFEEIAFLRAQQGNPALARIPGARHELVMIWSQISVAAWITALLLLIFVDRRRHGWSFKESLNLKQARRDLEARIRQGQPVGLRPLQSLDERTRIVAIGSGLVLVGLGIVLLVMAIQAHVWEGESIWSFLQCYAPIYFGLLLLGMVIRDYRLIHYGTLAPVELAAIRKLTTEQIEPIRRALEDRDWQAAIKRYREVVPEADAAEAKRYVGGLFASLLAQHKLVPTPLSFATLNWKVMGICTLIEAAILGVLWLAMPPFHPASAVSQFAYSLLFGIGLTAGGRVKGLWKRMLLLLPALAAMVLSETIVPRLAGASFHSIGPYLYGLFSGIFLVISGFTPRRRKV
jgi:tRNA A-37 threonylcarbamoyl transferase component Bud32